MQLLIPYAHVNDPQCSQAALSAAVATAAQLLLR